MTPPYIKARSRFSVISAGSPTGATAPASISAGSSSGTWWQPRPAAQRLSRRLLSDWQIAPILQIHSGQWLTVTSGTDRALTTVANQTVNQVLANPYASNKRAVNGNATINWLNPPAFGIPALGTYGTTADGVVVSPGLIRLNMALSRSFKIREKPLSRFAGKPSTIPTT